MRLARRRSLALAAMVVSAVWLALASVAQAQSIERFFPLLIDLPGWQGDEPDGVAMDMPGSTMVNAMRGYQRGAARLNAHLMIGAMAQGVVAATAIVKIESSKGRTITSTIDGLQVTRSFTFRDKAGAVTVVLGPSAVFMVSFNGIPEDESLKLAQQFNWKAMQAAIPK